MQNGCTLKFASAALRNDTEVVLEAVRQDPRSFEFASGALHKDLGVRSLHRSCIAAIDGP